MNIYIHSYDNPYDNSVRCLIITYILYNIYIYIDKHSLLPTHTAQGQDNENNTHTITINYSSAINTDITPIPKLSKNKIPAKINPNNSPKNQVEVKNKVDDDNNEKKIESEKILKLIINSLIQTLLMEHQEYLAINDGYYHPDANPLEIPYKDTVCIITLITLITPNNNPNYPK